ncbi:ATP-binding protein [Nitratidesulfovibrio vulgaris]|uniref:histidine kinase n=1 Tax=Nitratidesulfovibrio vulgaris (strain ATCC 29579 / DSM 644 / CCUG 34227 / NCIMB 8303 / VKM B-1760 / Hildenborough) TaxID=882 RepID=Q72EF6_NITV2|nr:ATP-binding protein [Nitratidesulfovibrio vulgaris]AAS95103.1 sensor histidine kinase/response regulator [Nitratidesulfovibrio vulgaris str. Hildenborough]ADP85737.1 multi-sensor hybrid histidine kinase [Nitratidesulfovibrio vulgaris RCH1]
MNWTWQTLRIPCALTLLWCLLLLGLYRWNADSEADHIHELALLQARSFFAQIVATRAWNAVHGGVLVPESAYGPPNPYLPEDDRVVTTSDGQRLTRVNPAYMTRQISEILNDREGVGFRITSLFPLRPENAPDVWEKAALDKFRYGEKEVFTLEQGMKGSLSHYRFMAPLATDATCMNCHRDERDVTGGQRGGISVALAAAPLLAVQADRLNTLSITYWCIAIVGVFGIGGATLLISSRQAVAEAANRMKSAFLANMSHDMRTPLTGIIGMADLLEAPGCPPERRSAYIAQLKGASANLLEIVNDITDYSCLESGRLRLLPRHFALRNAVDECLGLFRFTCEQKGLTLTADIPPGLPDSLTGDDFRLRQALGNLVSNAVKFTRRGTITVAVREEERSAEDVMLRFTVQDTGVGIPLHEQDAIFESFVQGGAAHELRMGGTGLGLAITRDIAAMCGGTAGVHSTPGTGSSFWFTARLGIATEQEARADRRQPLVQDSHVPYRSPLPPSEEVLPHQTGDSAAMTCSPASLSVASPAHRLRILVADDNPVNRLFLHDALTGAGYDVMCASDGLEALECLADGRGFSLALLDVRMPGLDGLDVLRHMRAGDVPGIRPDTPVLMVTASAAGDERAQLLNAPADGVIIKPLRVATLLEQVHRVLHPGTAAMAAASPPALPPSSHCPGDAPLPSASAASYPPPVAPLSTVASQQQDTTPLPVHDTQAALADLAGNEGLLARLYAAFLDDVPTRRTALMRTLEVRQTSEWDLAPLRREAHALCNSAKALHLGHLAASTSALEMACVAGAPDRRMLEAVITDLAGAETTLTALLQATREDA